MEENRTKIESVDLGPEPEGPVALNHSIQMEHTQYDQALKTTNEDVNVFLQDLRDGEIAFTADGAPALPKDGLIGSLRAVGTKTVDGVATLDPESIKMPQDAGLYNTAQVLYDHTAKKLETLAPKERSAVTDQALRDMADMWGMNPKALAKMFLGGSIKFDIKNPVSLGRSCWRGRKCSLMKSRFWTIWSIKPSPGMKVQTRKIKLSFSNNINFSPISCAHSQAHGQRWPGQ